MARFKVEQNSGEVTVTSGTGEATTYSVSRHVVDVPDEHAAAFAAAVPGAEPANADTREAVADPAAT